MAAAVVLVAVGAAGELPCCPKKKPVAVVAPDFFGAEGGSGLLLVATGRMEGYLEPCGCTHPQLGGVIRRGAFLARLREEGREVVAVDVGGLSEGAGRQAELKTLAGLLALRAMDYACFLPGEAELSLGAEALVTGLGASGVPAVCANVPSLGLPASQTFLAPRSRARVVITGAVSPGAAERAGVEAADPLGSLLPVVREVPEEAVLLVLFHGSAEEAQTLAEAVPSAAVVVASGEGDEPALLGRVLCPGSRGKVVPVVELSGPPWRPAGMVAVEMTEELGASEEVRSVFELYVRMVREERLLERYPRLPHPDGLAYLGTEVCADCHDEEAEVWRTSAHARAYETLREVGRERDPECVACHVVGLGWKGGFTTPEETPELEGVGCESCHGPHGSHRGDEVVPEMLPGEAVCRSCHDPEHSYGFEFEGFWKGIRH